MMNLIVVILLHSCEVDIEFLDDAGIQRVKVHDKDKLVQ